MEAVDRLVRVQPVLRDETQAYARMGFAEGYVQGKVVISWAVHRQALVRRPVSPYRCYSV